MIGSTQLWDEFAASESVQLLISSVLNLESQLIWISRPCWYVWNVAVWQYFLISGGKDVSQCIRFRLYCIFLQLYFPFTAISLHQSTFKLNSKQYDWDVFGHLHLCTLPAVCLLDINWASSHFWPLASCSVFKSPAPFHLVRCLPTWYKSSKHSLLATLQVAVSQS